MLLTTLNSAPVWLLNHEPEASDRLRLSVSMPADLARSATGRELRRPEATELRAEIAWSHVCTSRVATQALLHSLQARQDEPVVAPVWPALVAAEDYLASPLKGGLVVVWNEGWTDHELLTDPSPETLAAYDYAAPAILGRFASQPRSRLVTDELTEVTFEVIEDSPAALALAPVSAALATSELLAAPVPIFPLPLEWSRPPEAGSTDYSVDSEQIGPGRESARSFYPQAPERIAEGKCLLTSHAEIATLLAWWRARCGPVSPHFVSAYVSAGRLAGAPILGANTLTLEAAANLGINSFLMLSDPGHLDVEIVRVESVDGNLITLADPLARDWPAGTNLSFAMLARHLGSKLDIVFASPTIAAAQIRWREVAPEYTTPEGEVAGETIGAAPAKAWLFELIEDYVGSTVTTRLTSHESNLTSAGDVLWTHRPGFDAEGDIRQSFDLSRDELTLKARWWANCPFRHFLPGQLKARVFLKVYEATVNDAAAEGLQLIFSGQVKSAPRDGALVAATVGGPNELFARKLPGDLFQVQCNAQLYDTRCGLSRAAWEFSATITAIDGVNVTVDPIALVIPRTLAGFFEEPTTHPAVVPGCFAASWFAGGYLQWTTPADITLRVPIYNSTLFVDVSSILTLRSSAGLTVGDTVILVPGCNKRRDNCGEWHPENNPGGRFNNYDNFRGFPFIPDRAPQFTPPKRTTSASGKK